VVEDDNPVRVREVEVVEVVVQVEAVDVLY
jgi:hypothetical protein